MGGRTAPGGPCMPMPGPGGNPCSSMLSSRMQQALVSSEMQKTNLLLTLIQIPAHARGIRVLAWAAGC